jgi:hypothetical protein
VGERAFGSFAPCWYLGDRDAEDAAIFISNLAERLTPKIQLTTDGHSVYVDAAQVAFGYNID